MWILGFEIPAKSGHEENSNENETNESNGTPALLGADFGIAIDLGPGGKRAASTSRNVTKYDKKRERLTLGNILSA
jgi:hypothetical protein